ncbi:MAG: Choice-of-anchor protein, partial [Bacteroidota bacterium]|nr:Choice-of-anchor protein [Bacteroidota bacterium]
MSDNIQTKTHKRIGLYRLKFIPLFAIIFIYDFILLYSAPVISYILPDIGTPGMNTYIEILAPNNANGNFGPDGLYTNNTDSQIKIEFVNPLDSQKVIFGPLVVSWNGRLISTQVFVNQNLSPNSWYWQVLSSKMKIPFRINVSGNLSNVDTFYIVQPFQFGNKGGNAERIIGEGSLGTRSRRGAMIVDSMILGNGIYKVSTIDCDPTTPGNQGYLPFVLLSKGKILSRDATSISISGTNRNGGPGGGGGGGNFCDASFINPGLIGDDGGDGFTGGGPGGKNCSGCSNAYKNTGTGTGAGGSSINGVRPSSPEWYESSGGGTGHPFGSSGIGCGDGNNCNPEGGNGGGSGCTQNKEGGSGGYGTSGGSFNSVGGGKIHGNEMGVPLAGGSGGASGNPNSPHECSGSGGGGGGAISIFSWLNITNIDITSQGVQGGRSGFGNGGDGSGGFISTMAKVNVRDMTLDVSSAGAKGGTGRIRHDYPNPLGALVTDLPSSVHVVDGLTTDTSTWIRRKHLLTGSRKDQA